MHRVSADVGVVGTAGTRWAYATGWAKVRARARVGVSAAVGGVVCTGLALLLV